MTVAFTIPGWLLWTLGLLVGVPLIIVVLGLAYVGWVFARGMTKGGGFWR